MPEVIPPNKQYAPANNHEEEEVVATGSLDVIERSALQHQVVVAKKYPRDYTTFISKLTQLAQMSQPVALEMMYSVPRAGKQLIGPSVRFAEALISCWGNATATTEVVDVDREWLTAEGRFYDCETNVRLAVRVRRRITDKEGRRFNADMIGVTGAAAQSIALRGAILRGVPKALWADKFEMAKETAVGKVKSITELRDIMFTTFAGLGVTELRLLNALEIAGKADVTTDHILAMQSWHKQLKAGDANIEEIFGSPDDDEIKVLMDQLGWNAAKQEMSLKSFKGKRTEHLAYLKDEAAKNGKVTSAAATEKPGPQAVKSKKDAKAKPTADGAQEQKPAQTEAATEQASPAKTEDKPAQADLKGIDNW